jgi:hypothetical protein
MSGSLGAKYCVDDVMEKLRRATFPENGAYDETLPDEDPEDRKSTVMPFAAVAAGNTNIVAVVSGTSVAAGVHPAAKGADVWNESVTTIWQLDVALLAID